MAIKILTLDVHTDPPPTVAGRGVLPARGTGCRLCRPCPPPPPAAASASSPSPPPAPPPAAVVDPAAATAARMVPRAAPAATDDDRRRRWPRRRRGGCRSRLAFSPSLRHCLPLTPRSPPLSVAMATPPRSCPAPAARTRGCLPALAAVRPPASLLFRTDAPCLGFGAATSFGWARLTEGCVLRRGTHLRA